MKPFVAFDLDEVILNLRDGMYAGMVRKLGHYTHWRQWTDFNHNQQFGVPDEDFLRMIVEECLLESAPIEPGAWDAIHAIRDLGFRTAVVTARGYHPRGEQITRDWLDQHDVAMDEVCIVPFGKSKADAIRALGSVVAYIDDHHKHLEALRAAGVGGMLALLDRPWNWSAGNTFLRVTSLEGFANELEILVAEQQ